MSDDPFRAESPGALTLVVNVVEAARILGIGVNIVRDLIRTGELPAIKLGTQYLIPRKTIAALVAKYALPQPATSVDEPEPKITRADDTGLLNRDYIVANAHKFTKVSAIYFLLRDDQIVYIGRALDVYARIATHVYEDKKWFTRVFMLHCDPTELNNMERQYIKKFSPQYNQVHNILKVGMDAHG